MKKLTVLNTFAAIATFSNFALAGNLEDVKTACTDYAKNISSEPTPI